MAQLAGYEGTVDWDSISTLKGVTRWELTIEDETPDATGMDSGGWREHVSGLRNWSATVEIVYDKDDVAHFESAVDAEAEDIVAGASADLTLDTDAAPSLSYSGTATLKRIAPTVEVDGVVKFSLEFIGDGELTYPSSA